MFGVLFHIICYDVWFYVSHIFFHTPTFYVFHKIHHKKKYSEIKYFDTNEGHYAEHIVQPLGILVPCFFPGFSPNQMIFSWTIIVVRGLMRHDDRFSWLIGNHHLLHHKHQKYNFGEYWIDKLFGTIYYDEREYKYGILYT
jgi:lathosterol oxidase